MPKSRARKGRKPYRPRPLPGSGAATAAPENAAATPGRWVSDDVAAFQRRVIGSDAWLRVIEDRVVSIVNDERRKRGLRPLRHDNRLHRSARARSDDMAARGYFAHIAPDGKSPGDWMRELGYTAPAGSTAPMTPPRSAGVPAAAPAASETWPQRPAQPGTTPTSARISAWPGRRRNGRAALRGDHQTRPGPRDHAVTAWEALTLPIRLSLIADGLSNPDVAAGLLLSRSTVHTHIPPILAKLGARSRTQIVSEALRHWRPHQVAQYS